MRLLVGTIAIALLVGGGPAAAEECVDHAAAMRWVGAWSRGAQCGDPFGFCDLIHHQGRLIAADQCGTVCMLDLADPIRPALLDEVEMSWGPAQIAAHGDHVYAAMNYDPELYVYRIDGGQLTTVAHLTSMPELRDIVVAGGKLYGVSETAFFVWDLAEPASPQILTSMPLAAGLRGLHIDGEFAYILGTGGIDSLLMLIRLDALGLPVEVAGSTPLENWAHTVDVDGRIAYVGTGAGLQVVDCSDPAHPYRAGIVRSIGGKFSVAVAGDRLVTGGDDVVVIDREATTDDEWSTWTRAYLPNGGAGYRVCVIGDLAYVAEINDMIAGNTRAGVNVYAIDRLGESPRPADQLSLVTYADCVRGMVGGEDFGHVVAAGDLVTFTVEEDGELVEVGRLTLAAEEFDVAAMDRVGSLAVLATAPPAQLTVVDLTDPQQPVLRGTVALSADPTDVAADRLHAFVACGRESLVVVDIADPDAPLVAAAVASQEIWRLDLAGDLLATAHRLEGVTIHDVSDPLAPAPLSTVEAVGQAINVHLEGSRLHVAHRWHAEVLDLVDPGQPVSLGACEVPTPNASVMTRRGVVYLGGGALKVVEARGTAAPRFLGASSRHSLSWSCRRGDLVTVGGWLVMGGRTALMSFRPHCDPHARDLPAGVQPTVPIPRPRLTAAPNPFNPATTLRFTVPVASPVRVTLHDAAGRRVQLLLAGDLEAGDHAVSWRGRDEAGRPMPSGVYFCRLEAAGSVITRKVLLLQ